MQFQHRLRTIPKQTRTMLDLTAPNSNFAIHKIIGSFLELVFNKLPINSTVVRVLYNLSER